MNGGFGTLSDYYGGGLTTIDKTIVNEETQQILGEEESEIVKNYQEQEVKTESDKSILLGMALLLLLFLMFAC